MATFKYLTFLTESLNQALGVLGFEGAVPLLRLTLPVGISFYTFQSMSYTIDVYRGRLKPTHNIFHFFAYLSMFPQLVAGPIVRAADLLPQLETASPVSDTDLWDGLRLVTIGYFKKVVIADNLAATVNLAFSHGAVLPSAPYWWAITTMFALQIYCDFSGYSDIARGLAKWTGYEFPLNFDHPYFSTSLRAFWSRWHISLSTWFRDYVYVPLGGSRASGLITYRNLWLAMLLSGLWHGAAWTFVVWGALHALFLSLERLSNWPKRLSGVGGALGLGVVLVLLQVWFAWVFFRAESLGQAVEIVSTMLDVTSFDFAPVLALGYQVFVFLALGIGTEIYWGVRARPRGSTARAAGLLEPAFVSALIVSCVFLRGPGSDFIYFQF